MHLPLSSSASGRAAVTRGRLHEQGRGQPPCLAGGKPSPGTVPGTRRSAEVEADAPGRVMAAAEDEMAYPDLAAARGAETKVQGGRRRPREC